MNEVGIIYELDVKKALVLTPDGEFIFIERQNHMLIGQQVIIENQDILRKKRLSYKSIGFASCIATVFIAILIFMGTAYFDNAYGYVNVDINPGIEFVIDREYKVVKSLPLNDSAKDIIDILKVKNKHVKDAILDLLEISIELKYLRPESNNMVLISAALKDEKNSKSTRSDDVKIMSDMMTSIEDSINQFDKNLNIVAQTVSLTKKEREEALKHNLSMGKYDLYLKTKEIKIDIEIEDVANMRVFELLEILDNYHDEKDVNKTQTLEPAESNETDPILKPTQAPKQVKGTETEPTLTPTQLPTQVKTHEPSTVEPTPKSVEIVANDFETKPELTPKPVEQQKYLVNDSLKIQYFSEDMQNDAQAVTYNFRILNTGTNTISLKDVKVRYYFKEDEDVPLGTFVYFFSHGDESEVHCSFYNITNIVNANRYLELKFSSGNIDPEEYVYVKGAFYRKDWSRFDQSNDYSFNPKDTSYVDWNKITAYIKDVLIWGKEPL